MTASIADIAGIIQGMGSLAAIGAAVWIYARQHQHKKADDNADTAQATTPAPQAVGGPSPGR